MSMMEEISNSRQSHSRQMLLPRVGSPATHGPTDLLGRYGLLSVMPFLVGGVKDREDRPIILSYR